MAQTGNASHKSRVHSASPAVVLTATTLLTGSILTLAVLGLPLLRFAYEAHGLRVMLETCNALAALLVGYIVFGRYRQSERLQTLLLAIALGTVAVANLVLTAIPSAVLIGQSELTRWSPAGVRMLGTALFFAAALTPLAARVGRRRAALIGSSLAAVAVAAGVIGITWGGGAPPTVDPPLVGDGSQLLLVSEQALGTVMYALAAVIFTRQAGRTGDQLIRWVAAGCVLAVLARVHYLMYPSLDTVYVHTGDLFRLGAYVFMLVGAMREITNLWQLRTAAAVAEDRRRMARDLHDGLTQELSYIWAQSQRLATHPEDTVLAERIRGAADRAIDESRRAIAALTRRDEGPLDAALEHHAEELAHRYDVKIVVTTDRVADVDAALVEALLRITGEAVRNAVRHGAANRIDIKLSTTPLSLTVTDDGCGFSADRADVGLGGFGLTSMRERAALVGGTLKIESAPGDGTTVRLGWC